jgi:hypothetical protein
MLDDVFAAQRQLNHRTVGIDVCSIDDEMERLRWFRNYLTAWDQELKELLESLDLNGAFTGLFAEGFKLDEQNIRIEVVDMLHFLVSMFQVIGETSIDGRKVPGSPADFGEHLARLVGTHEDGYGMPMALKPAAGAMNRLLALHGLHAAVETGQLLDKVQWKWWAHQGNRWQEARDHLYTRMLPRWSLLVLSSGMGAAEVTDLYMKKNKLNFERQEGGYKEGTYVKRDASGREDNAKLFEKT